ncbi:integrase, catalytic region, zinc finger, CCHC-type containing protein [Tanacetum coccineum]|uniref:Integrase, catalytic region, zinc finger, CCHC-type containing protein n=1 Tax=Tanacetum coccineum TaxID=301880 RepID=A0ABQ5HI22_9ASTR
MLSHRRHSIFKNTYSLLEGIQKALTKEIKEMEEVFKELEAEVDQNVINRKHDEIERKNLLIANDNLIAKCLSKEVFYIAGNSELTCDLQGILCGGLGHKLFFVRQFCNSDLEVAFKKHSRMMSPPHIAGCSKASKTKSWLWHRRLSHLNFGTINDLARKDLVRGLPRLKFEKDHLCSACQLEKSKKPVALKNKELEILFQPMFDEYLEPPRVERLVSPAPAVPVPV